MPRKEGDMDVKVARKAAIEEKLMQNLVELQKVHTNLAEKFDSLSKQISSLLNLFEITARGFATNPANQMSDKDREFLDKVDKLLEQNKTIAKGLTLMEDRIKDRSTPKVPESVDEQSAQFSINPRPLPKF